MLYSVIKQKGRDEFVRVGIVAKNDNNEIMLINDNIDRINTSIKSIPYVDIKEFNEVDIISEFNNKYGIRINNLKSYINESSFLDEMCNERLQVNMECNIVNNNNIEGVSWTKTQNILTDIEVPTDLKQCIEVYTYNENINKY